MNMINKKRIISVALIICLLVNTFAGCLSSKKAEDDNTLTITLMYTTPPQIMESLRAEFPDINFVVEEYAGSNAPNYKKQQLIRGEGGDIFFYTTFFNSKDVGNYLVDLSGYPFLANYDKSILSTLDINGAIYQIPGPIAVRYIAVNKTLFEEKGWKIPQNFEEMVAVCKQIHEEEPTIAPLGLGSLDYGFIWSLVTSYTQMGFLDTTEGRLAEEAYRKGTASFANVFDEGLDMVSQLIDARAFMPEKFRDTLDVSAEQMGNREVAMCYVMKPHTEHTKLFSGQAKGDPAYGKYSDDEFVTLPLFGKNEKNKGLILVANNTWGISKYLEEKGNEKKLENALRVLEYISSEKGQYAIRYEPSAIPAIKNLPYDDIPEFMKNLWNDSTNSIKSFSLYTGYEHIITETGAVLLDAMYANSSVGMRENFVLLADRLNKEFLANEGFSDAFGYVQDDLTVPQTRKLCCEAFCATANAELAIVSEGGIKNGVLNTVGLCGRLFKGDITSESLTIILTKQTPNIFSVTLTGKEIQDMLENGKLLKNDEGNSSCFTYWANGVDVEKNDNKITKITLNGKALDNNSTYTVAMIDRDYQDDFENNHAFTDTGVCVMSSLENYFKAKGTIKAQ